MATSITKLKCDKVCKKAVLKVEELKMKVDLFLLPFDVANVLLGVQWMKSIGMILLDYNELTIEFNCKEEKICWKGGSWLEKTL